MVISHERDLLNNVVDNILHLQGGKLTLYPGGYDSFERQRAERAAQLEAAKASQDAQRARLQDYVNRNSARASTAKQAQSRAKMLARMQPIAALMEDPSLSLRVSRSERAETAAAHARSGGGRLHRGYAGAAPPEPAHRPGRAHRAARPQRQRQDTLARLLAAQLPPMEGEVNASPKMKVGYFTQYQVEELSGDDTPLQHMTRVMPDAKPGMVRAHLGRFGFSGDRATALVESLSGGERARLALALITRDAPHLLILDEPTNHLDVDAREALVQALNDYEGAVILISHDRHMVELTADRLVLVDEGQAVDYDGSMDDYIDFVLGGKPGRVPKEHGDREVKDSGPRKSKKDRKADARKREDARKIKVQLSALEKSVAELQRQCTAIDRAMFEPTAAPAGNLRNYPWAIYRANAPS